MKRLMKLTREEREIEDALVRGEFVDVDRKLFESVAKAVAARKKDTVLNLRVNGQDLHILREKAKRLGVPYQSFISEFLHCLAHS